MVKHGRRQAAARSKPRIAPKNHLAPAEKVRRWFDDALDEDDPKPQLADCERLARQFKTIVNRHNNAELERRGDAAPEELKDVDLAEWLNKKVRSFTIAAKQLMVEADKIEYLAGGYRWGAVSLGDVQDILEQIITSPEASAALATETLPPPPSRRRPREAWHAAGREMALLIQDAMRDVNYHGRLKMADAESVTATVGAAAISWAYSIVIAPAGFATAMKERSRSRKTKRLKTLTDEERFNERFPGAARIKMEPLASK
jgi:hypothetical protein